jgi:hypothetical protein
LKGHEDDVRCLAFSPDGQRLATGSADSAVKLWDVGARKETATLTGHGNGVKAVVFSRDGKTLASASADRTVKLWDVGTAKITATLSGHTNVVWGLAFSPDGKILASAGDDSVLCLWDMPPKITPPDPKVAADTAPSLQGTWDLGGVTVLGKGSVTGLFKIAFRKDEAEWDQIPFLLPPGKGALTVDPSRNPPTFELKYDNKVYKGIYQLRTTADGEGLALLIGEPGGEAPKAFAEPVFNLPPGFKGSLITGGRKRRPTVTGSSPPKHDLPPATAGGDPATLERNAIGVAARFGGEKAFANSDLKEQPLEFQFGYPGPTDADLESLRAALAAVPRGVGLNLNEHKNISDAGIASLKDMPNLVSLSISGTKVTPKCLETVKTLKGLVYLSMNCKDLTDADLAQLGGLTNLQVLSIYNDKLTENGLAGLAGLTAMRQFHACPSLGDAGVGHIKGWSKLEVLALQAEGLQGENVTDATVARLKGFPELRELRLEAPQISDAALADLGGLSKLEKLEFSRCFKLTDAGLPKLKGLTSLKRLEFGNTKVTEAGVAELKKALPACEIRRY